MEEKVYYCENCGGIMEFDTASQSLKCPNCDTIVQIENHREDVVEHSFTAQAARTYSVQEKTSSTMTCTGCGATIEVAGDATAGSCLYCGSSYVLADKQEAAIIPDGVIPFKIDANRVREIFGNWIKKRYFAPSNLKNLYQSGLVQGRYIPFWTFDAECHATYTAFGGRDRTEEYRDREGKVHTRTVTDWYFTSGSVDHFFDDVLICGTGNFKASLLGGVDSYDTREVASYSPEYFSGYMSESYTVDLGTAHQNAVSLMNGELHAMAESDILSRYDRAKGIHMNIRYAAETFKHIIVPLYATSYAYNNKNYTVLVNGQNGEIKGEYPKSVGKIGLLIAIIILILTGFFIMCDEDGKLATGEPQEQRYVCEEYEAQEEECENRILQEVENGFVW